ncbi:hypothetical protein LXD69_04365 [Flavobacterium sediminilitoris]|uniref:Uncharacterized protein n=1 Tax=Flavobacterium sediminilitoris TaxID=2024526 RepID=A0ABY4HPX3_9FLAO|nr:MULTISPECIES: hypothetical protein [Flavobacterium]UOX34743.1 hypothetical protein LXD69_04365 [Flavobacterium sediminilitoris]
MGFREFATNDTFFLLGAFNQPGFRCDGGDSDDQVNFSFRFFNNSKKGIGGFQGLGYSTKFTSYLSKIINPLNSKANCVFCAIEFQKRIMNMAYGAAKNTSGYGLEEADLAAELFRVFGGYSSKIVTEVGVDGLKNTLNTQLKNHKNFTIIVGRLRDQSKFKAHAFNGILIDGDWHFMDLQNGVLYKEKAMERVFTSYRFYDVYK